MSDEEINATIERCLKMTDTELEQEIFEQIWQQYKSDLRKMGQFAYQDYSTSLTNGLQLNLPKS